MDEVKKYYLIEENELRRFENAIDFYSGSLGFAIRSRPYKDVLSKLWTMVEENNSMYIESSKLQRWIQELCKKNMCPCQFGAYADSEWMCKDCDER